MSRTYKDSLYLIQKHTPQSRLSLFTSYICDHHLFGTSGKRPISIYNRQERKKAGHYERGEDKITKYYEPVFAHEITQDMELFHDYSQCGELIYYVQKTKITKTRVWVENENYETSYLEWQYADHCTQEEFTKRVKITWQDFFNQKNEEGELYPCHQSIGYRYWSKSPHSKEDRKEYHDKHRAKARTEDRYLTKLYNSGEDLEDYDWEDPNYRMHRYWW